MFRPTCQRLFTEFLSANHAPAHQCIELVRTQIKILESFDRHEPALVQALSDEKKPRPIKADGLEKSSTLAQENEEIAFQ